MHKLLQDKFKLIAAMFIFGTIGVVRKYIPYPSSVIALVRACIGTFFLLGVHLCKREKLSSEALKSNLLLLCASGILLGGNWILLFEAYQYTSVSTATVCYYMAPVFVILVSPLLFHEVFSLRKGLCAAAAVCGMVMVSGVIETGFSGTGGIMLGLGAAVMYAAVIILNKFINNIPANQRTLFQLGVAAISLLPYVLLTEDLSQLKVNGFLLMMLAIVGIVHTGIAYMLYFGSVKGIPAQTVALYSYIDPVTAVILSVFVLKEHMSAAAVFGAALVIGAMIISELKGTWYR